MKFLLTFSILLSANFSLKAEETDAITIITPTPYERVAGRGQNLKSSAGVWIGDMVGMADIGPKIRNSIGPYKGDLVKYFKSSAELDILVENLISEAKRNVIGYHTNLLGNTVLNSLDDDKAIQVNKFFGNKLIGNITDRILNSEGVKDPARRKIWRDKILTPFNRCIDSSTNALYSADHCMSALTSSLVPSLGVGLVFELSRDKLGSSLPENTRAAFYANQVTIYKECMKKSPVSATAVKDCALSAMRKGVLKITDSKLSNTITKTASSPAASKTIKQSVWPAFNTCAEKIGSDKNSKVELSDQFMNCIDDLVRSTGALLVQDKLANTPAVKSHFSKNEMTTLISDKVQAFKNCIDDQKKNNNRKDGILDTDKCENTITNDITYKVVVKTLAGTAVDSFKNSPKRSGEIAKQGKELLDQCWDNGQNGAAREQCLRKTVLSFSQIVAKEKLDQAIPDELTIKNDLIKSSLKDLNKCLEKQLPANISEADNISALTDICSNKLTQNVALQVARESVRKKAIESKLSPKETEQLLSTYVDQKFSACIGSRPSDEKLENCSGELKKNVATSLASKQIRMNAEGKMTPQETDALVKTLVTQKFTTCMGSNPSDSVLDSCIADLTRGATKSIVLSYEKKQLKEQLNADKTPSKIKPVEDAFIACVDKPRPVEKVSAALDECTKQFSLGFARILGEVKLTSLLKSVLGTEGFNEQKKNIDDILAKYNSCLDDLKAVPMNDGLLDKLTVCTDGLQRRGVNFVSNTVNNWMSTEQKDAATIMVKNEFANFVPCLGSLMPSSPYSQQLDQNVQSVLKPVAILLSQYIEYSPEDARKSLEDIIRKLSTDLKDVANNPASRKELIDFLYKNGTLDQFLKAVVRGKVKESLDQTPESELPKELRASLLSKANFDAIFASPEGQTIKDMVMEKILKPVLMEQASMESPLMKAGMDAVQEKVTRLLVNSPNFGDQIIKSSIQSKINDMGGMTKFFAKVFYGSKSLDWEKVRTTADGKAAEEFIREKVLLPKFKGTPLPKQEEEKIMIEAEKLVKAAVKNYD